MILIRVFFLCLFFSKALAGTAEEPSPHVIVIFGSTGDLTSRKLLPAVYNLAMEQQLGERLSVVGFARREGSDDSLREQMVQAVDSFSRNKPIDQPFWEKFQTRLFYNQGEFEKDEGYEKLGKLLAKLDKQLGAQNRRIYFLATQPSYFPTIIEKLHEHSLINPETKVMIEKPFGSDLKSAISLQKTLSKYLEESQIYRVDHYLGKIGVQNISTLRFDNALFEPVWNRHFIDRVDITISEEIGIGTRARLFEETGLLRDIFQNHLLQLFALVAMEPPATRDAASMHKEKAKVLRATLPFPLKDLGRSIIYGQYGPGKIQGKEVVGYLQENGVAPTSTVETFVAAKLLINNERWRAVPFYLRAGKRLSHSFAEIAMRFKKGEVLFIRIQPQTALDLQILSQVPSIEAKVQPALFGYNLNQFFHAASPEAYEKLFYECMRGDQSLFVTEEEELATWRLLTPVLEYWKAHPEEKPLPYEAGTDGPLLK